MKKTILGIGAITAVAAPIAAVVSCGDDLPGKISDFKSIVKMHASKYTDAALTDVKAMAVDAQVTEAQLGIDSITTPAAAFHISFKNGLQISKPYDPTTKSVEIKLTLVYEEKEYPHTFTVYAADSEQSAKWIADYITPMVKKLSAIKIGATKTILPYPPTPGEGYGMFDLMTITGIGNITAGTYPTSDELEGYSMIYTVEGITKPADAATAMTATGNLTVVVEHNATAVMGTATIQITVTGGVTTTS